jgi:hypothetical protein
MAEVLVTEVINGPVACFFEGRYINKTGQQTQYYEQTDMITSRGNAATVSKVLPSNGGLP